MSAQDLGHVQSQQLILAWCLAENHAPRTMPCGKSCLLSVIPLISVTSATGLAVNTGGSSLVSGEDHKPASTGARRHVNANARSAGAATAHHVRVLCCITRQERRRLCANVSMKNRLGP